MVDALLTFARAENATQLVLGDSRRSRLTAFVTGPGIGSRTIRESGDIDVHIVTHRGAGAGRRLPRLRTSLSARRVTYGYLFAVLLPVVTALVLVPLRDDLNLVSDMLLFLLMTVIVSLIGGLRPALLSAVGGSVLLNYFFTPPLHTLTIRDTNNALARPAFLHEGLVRPGYLEDN